MVGGVIFDMDGIMFDTEPLWTAAWSVVLPEFGIDEVPEGLADACRGSSGETTFRIVRSFLGQEADAPAIWTRMRETVYGMLEEGVEKKPGLDELLAFLVERDVPRAIASSSPHRIIDMDLAHAGMGELFDVIVSGEDVSRSKPDPQVFLVAAERLGVEPTRTLVLEDSLNGVRAGAAGGFVTVMVPDLIAPTDDLRSVYTRCCANLLEVRDLLAAGELG